MANPLYQKHIISINDLSRDDLNLVLATAAKLKANPQPELLKHKVIASCFFEASTRTRLSFETSMPGCQRGGLLRQRQYITG